jgi:gliding motility-associated-like protein
MPVLPTAFTPNGDGHNDILFIRGGPFKELDMRIYNEWGNEIFHGTSQAEGWDGTIKGEPQPGGKYIWTLKGISIHNDPVKSAGQIMLIR